MATKENAKAERFRGNFDSLFYGGKDGVANAVSDGVSAGISYGYTALAVAAREEGAAPGPIGWVGNAVTLTIGLATAGSVCKAIGAAAGTGAGILAGMAAFEGGPLAQYAAGTFASWATQKVATAVCETIKGDVNGYPVKHTPPADAKAVSSPLPSAGGEPKLPPEFAHLPLTGDVATMAAAIVKCRPSPDYSGSDGAYTIQRGQSLSSIARHNGVSVSLLEETNPQIIDPAAVRVGQIIRLPATAKDYVAGNDVASAGCPIPDDSRQTTTLTHALRQSAGTTVSVVAENSGQIAVLSPSSGKAIMIANDGTASSQALSAYDRRLGEIYTEAVAKGYVTQTTHAALAGHSAAMTDAAETRAHPRDQKAAEPDIYGLDGQGNIARSLVSGDLQAGKAHAEQWLEKHGSRQDVPVRLKVAP